MKMDGKFVNIVNEQAKKQQAIQSSIQSRLDFLNNTELNNKQNEVNRLHGIHKQEQDLTLMTTE